MSIRLAAPLALSSLILAASSAVRADDAPISITLQNHHFTPSEVKIPAGKQATLMVRNLDQTPAEFESDDFSAEKVLPTGQDAKIVIGPLDKGTYEFHDEYHEDESKAKLTVE